MGYHETGPALLDSGLSGPTGTDIRADVGRLVIGAADGDDDAWRQLIGRFAPVVTSIAGAHRLSSEDTTEVINAVWLRLHRHLGQIRRPDRVGTWLAAVARDECVQLLMATA